MKFIDTNIFVYAFDETDPRKTSLARTLLTEISSSGKGCISTQVVAEFCNVVLKKSVVPLKPTEVRKIIRELFSPLLLHQPDTDFYERVLETIEKYPLSFYDSAIVQAANDLRCTILYSEDMQANARYGTVKVVNPFI